MIPGSTRSVSGGAQAVLSQVSFSPDGGLLVVTGRGTHTIDTLPIFRQGSTGIFNGSSGGKHDQRTVEPSVTRYRLYHDPTDRQTIKDTPASYGIRGELEKPKHKPKKQKKVQPAEQL